MKLSRMWEFKDTRAYMYKVNYSKMVCIITELDNSIRSVFFNVNDNVEAWYSCKGLVYMENITGDNMELLTGKIRQYENLFKEEGIINVC